ncbi:glycosyltransferase [Chitinophaga sp. CF418]|uniref:glycosyltransferase n=1 Tax=Chitinophaga sp. CF418 TaxID=1855287 RepID=UPI000912896D|nr:glycosyltransferase [Chitinophaga sp. CF418]SHN28114.1 Glycosyltransferase involved in cell wall bisynthesis [Chitinophaga sp. CF418]
MSMNRKFVFWQNMVSVHQSCFLHCLSLKVNVEVVLVTVVAIEEKRKRMGWTIPDMGRVKLIVSPEQTVIDEIVASSDKNTYHIFSGFDSEPLFSNAFAYLTGHRHNVGIMAEPYSWLGLKGKIRYLRSIYHRLRYGRRFDFILAIGSKGMEVYSKAGYKKDKLFEWGYFVQATPPVTAAEDTAFRVMYAGGLVPNKGVHTLIKAWSNVKNSNGELNIIGDGPEAPMLKSLVDELSLSNVKFSGFQENGTVIKLMGQHDLFVLPSILKEGWGAVINEALQQGTPVICTDHCGASVLLGDHNFSTVIRAGDVNRLSEEMNKRISAGKVPAGAREKIRRWSECLSGGHAADYFLDIIHCVYGNGAAPQAPWRKGKKRGTFVDG